MTRSKTPTAASDGLAHGLWRQWETGLDHFWQGIFGLPDLGAVDFQTLERRTTPNDALACPQGFCPEAQPDFEPPIFSVSASELRAVVSQAALSEHGTMLLQSDPRQDRFLVRTRFMRFPDTVVVETIERGAENSTLALYSRSQIGRSDFGVNRRRLERWVARIGRLAAQEPNRSSP